ncbi:TetR/AcrR family transcriptional regulator [Streptomyces capoamus]|uniref:TetR/AcrR family transcriptional regulator n=1 Tax=Streptomyces capoamus TaxID=68183 RepID=UPI0016778FFE|nr:TetR/AcrR family transcriptional regulator [Streptomyces capoamus]
MASTPSGPPAPRLRADAARNRAQILAAARAAFRESGTAVPLDEIARRAGVNIATLYRRFPDRDALITQVVVDGFSLVLDTARVAAQTAQTDPLAAVQSFLQGMIDNRELLSLPLIGGPMTNDPHARDLQQHIAAALEEILAAGRSAEVLRPDITAVDLIATAALICRPLPHLPPEQAATLATRHLCVFLDGLRPEHTRALPSSPTHEEITAHLFTEETT